MRRKWDKIDYSFESRLVGAELLRQTVLEDLKLGISVKEISAKTGTSTANIYRIKRNYYDK